jgi:hypothetical protein
MVIEQNLTNGFKIILFVGSQTNKIELTVRKETKDTIFVMDGYYQSGHLYFKEFRHGMTIHTAAQFFTELDEQEDLIMDYIRKYNLD